MISSVMPAILIVHLQRGDARLGTGHLEVHVAEVIFIAKDIGEHGEAVTVLDQSHGDPRYVGFHRHARIHQCQTTAAHRGH